MKTYNIKYNESLENTYAISQTVKKELERRYAQSDKKSGTIIEFEPQLEEYNDDLIMRIIKCFGYREEFRSIEVVLKHYHNAPAFPVQKRLFIVVTIA